MSALGRRINLRGFDYPLLTVAALLVLGLVIHRPFSAWIWTRPG